MTLITLPNPLADGSTAYGSKTLENMNAIVTVVNGQLTNENLSATAAIAGTRLANLAVNAAKLAADAVTTVKILDANVTTAKLADANVTGVKMAEDDGGSEGQGANVSRLFTERDQAFANYGAGGSTGTDDAEMDSGKTIWCYFHTNSTSDVLIDDSIDWRYRMIEIMQWTYDTATPKALIPNGASAATIRHGIWSESTGSWSGNKYTNHGISYSGPGTGYFLYLETAELDTNMHYAWRADSGADGALKVKMGASPANDIAAIVRISCSPYIGAGV